MLDAFGCLMSALTSLLVRDDIVSVRQIEDALQRQILDGVELDTALLEVDALPENVIIAYRAASERARPASREEVMGASSATRVLLPADLAKAFRVTAISHDATSLTLATATPLSAAAIAELSAQTGMRIEWRITSELRVYAALERFYGRPLPPRMAALIHRVDSMSAGEVMAVEPLQATPRVAVSTELLEDFDESEDFESALEAAFDRASGQPPSRPARGPSTQPLGEMPAGGGPRSPAPRARLGRSIRVPETVRLGSDDPAPAAAAKRSAAAAEAALVVKHAAPVGRGPANDVEAGSDRPVPPVREQTKPGYDMPGVSAREHGAQAREHSSRPPRRESTKHGFGPGPGLAPEQLLARAAADGGGREPGNGRVEILEGVSARESFRPRAAVEEARASARRDPRRDDDVGTQSAIAPAREHERALVEERQAPRTDERAQAEARPAPRADERAWSRNGRGLVRMSARWPRNGSGPRADERALVEERQGSRAGERASVEERQALGAGERAPVEEREAARAAARMSARDSDRAAVENRAAAKALARANERALVEAPVAAVAERSSADDFDPTSNSADALPAVNAEDDSNRDTEILSDHGGEPARPRERVSLIHASDAERARQAFGDLREVASEDLRHLNVADPGRARVAPGPMFDPEALTGPARAESSADAPPRTAAGSGSKADALRERLVAAGARRGAPMRLPAGPLSAAVAADALAAAEERDAVVEVFFRFARQYFDMSALLSIKDERASGTHAYNASALVDVRQVSVPIPRGGAIDDMVRSLLPRVSDLSRRDEDRVLALALKRVHAQPAALIPMCIKRRVVSFVYGDRGGERFTLDELSELQGLLPHVSRAFERIIRTRKALGLSSTRTPERRRERELPHAPTQRSIEIPALPPAPPADDSSSVADPRQREALEALGVPRPAPTPPTPPAARPNTRDYAFWEVPRDFPARQSEVPREPSARDFTRPSEVPRAPEFGRRSEVPRASAARHSEPPRAAAPRHSEPPRAPVARHSEPPPRAAARRPDPLDEIDPDSYATARMSIEPLSLDEPDQKPLAHYLSKPPPGAGSYKSIPPGAETTRARSDKPHETEAEKEDTQPVRHRRSGPSRSKAPRQSVPPRSPAPVPINSAAGRASLHASKPAPGTGSYHRQGVTTELISMPPGPAPAQPPSDKRESVRPAAEPALPLTAADTIAAASAPTALAAEPAPAPEPGVEERKLAEQLLADLATRKIDEDLHGVQTLRSLGEPALQLLLDRFPGPLWFDRRKPHARVPFGRDIGPFCRALEAFGEQALARFAPVLRAKTIEARYYATLFACDRVHPALLEPLLERLFDEDAQIRLLVRDVLPHYRKLPGFARVAERLCAQASASSAPLHARLAAIDAIGVLRDAASVPTLIELVAHGDKQISVPAHRALCAITCQDFAKSAKKWRAWYDANAYRHRVEWLIEGLMHADQSLRASAGLELQKLTQVYYGYVAGASKRDREMAQKRYWDWWRGEGRNKF